MNWTRRRLLQAAPAVLSGRRPAAAQGVTAGDVTATRALIWSRADGPSRMIVRWRERRPGASWTEVMGPHCLEVTDFTGRMDISGWSPGSDIEYEVIFRDLGLRGTDSAPARGSFRPAPVGTRPVRFFWSGDTVGQGWGINPSFGGMKIYETMRSLQPDFFLHSGDTIYADGPVPAEMKLPDGTIWKNIVTDEKSKAAETLAEFRGAYKYNLLDENLRRFQAEVPQIWQWDDHEVLNNWSASKSLANDPKFTEKSVALLAARGKRAFLEYAPIRYNTVETERVYRHIPYGPLLDVFVIDMRSYRGPNSYNRQEREGSDTDFLGAPQMGWLMDGLRASRAKWKVIASDMPIGLLVADGKDEAGRSMFEATANGGGPPLGRELEMARLLKGIRDVKNTVWLTADVHYTAAHYYDPSKAMFTEFSPFWEFISGPLHAGSFGPGTLDNTFGPQVVFQKHPPPGQGGIGPAAGLQFFGDVEISAAGEMTVRLRDMTGAVLFEKRLAG
ncbi:MAG TPA: alkaline phosphatase D family protein [Bryobacteraceae bacterium]|nr:alkaline phosphatase D family protein [Bryobacteraceae bacterium]